MQTEQIEDVAPSFGAPDCRPPDLPRRSCTYGVLASHPLPTSRIADLVRAAYYDLATGRMSETDLDDVLRGCGSAIEQTDHAATFTAERRVA